jgi:hypothetical protein
MDGYLIWLAFIVFGILAATAFQIKDSRYRQLQTDNQQLQD